MSRDKNSIKRYSSRSPSQNRSSDETVVQAATHQFVRHTQISVNPLPIPSALEMAAYEKIRPGFFDVVIKHMEEQSSHRRQMETRQLELVGKFHQRQHVRATTAQYLTAGVALLMLVLAFVLGIYGYQTACIALASINIGGLVGVFAADRWRSSKNKEPMQPQGSLPTSNTPLQDHQG